MTAEEFLADLPFAASEVVLAAGALILLLTGALMKGKGEGLIDWACMALLIAAAVVAARTPDSAGTIFGGLVTSDALTRFAKPITFVLAAGAIWLARGYFQRERLARFEWSVLIVFATIGMGVMISSTNLITLYLGAELQSLPLYILAAANRDSPRASEAGVKYFTLGALSSGILLYGLSLVYGAAGSTDFAAINAVASQTGGPSVLLLFGLVFTLAGLAFKISAAPFHMWTPDVYEGAPTPITAFFAAVPKIAAMVLILRVTLEGFAGAAPDWQQVVAAAALLSMALGAFAAIGQTNIKRLLAYSSIGHMGYALVGLSAGTPAGVQGVLTYLALYALMTLGAFACVLAMRRADGQVEDIDDLAGLSQRQPALAAGFAVLMFSLAGVPPTAGFLAKWWVFAPAVEAGLLWLAIAGLLSAVVAAYYYLRVVKLMYFDEPAPAFESPRDLGVGVIAAMSAVAMFPVLFIFGGVLYSAAGTGASALF